jgi:hypothetical protein
MSDQALTPLDPANIPFYNQAQYYEDEDLHGVYQYVTLDDVINNFLLMYTGDDKLINNVRDHVILFHAKRGLQELTFDALKEIKAIETELSPTLTLTLPDDYVNYVRVSWIDDCGKFHPMLLNNDTRIAKNYLQDHEYNILFDDEGEGLEANNNSYDPAKLSSECMNYMRSDDISDCVYGSSYNGNFGLNTSKANVNGWFTIDKRRGIMKFSSQVKDRPIVLEYISDGLEYRDPKDIRVHKLAEQALYDYIRWMILTNKIGIQEYIVRRAKKDFGTSKRIAKGRIQGIRWNELVMAIRGKSKWIK